MIRILVACLLVIGAHPAVAQQSLTDRMSALLPHAVAGWMTTGPRSKEVLEGPSKGVIVFQLYQKEARTVIVRFTQNPVELVTQIITKPSEFNFKPITFKGRRAVIKDDQASGSVLIQVKPFVVSIDWSGDATRKDAMAYADAVDIDALAKLAHK